MPSPDPDYRLRLFSFVLQGEVLAIWLIYGICYGLLGLLPNNDYLIIIVIAAGLALTISLLKYCYIITEFTARGHNRVPRMGMENFAGDFRVYRQLVILLLFYGLHDAVAQDIVFVVDLALMFIAPAVSAFVTFHYSLLQAINPVNVWRFVRAMGGSRYTLLRVLTLSVMTALLTFLDWRFTLLDSPAGIIAMSLCGVGLVLVMFRLSGILLHYRADELGIRTDISQGQLETRWRAQQAQRLDRLRQQIHQLTQQRRIRDAYRLIERFLKRERYRNEAEVYATIKTLQDPQVAWLMAEGYVARLADRDPATAWRICEEVDNQGAPTFAPASGSAVITLARNTTTNNQRRLAVAMLKAFAQRFPGHPMCRQAYLLLCRLALEAGDDDLAVDAFQSAMRTRGALDPEELAHCRSLMINAKGASQP